MLKCEWFSAEIPSDCEIWWRNWRYLRPQPSYYKWKIFSTALLTLNFDLDLSKLTVTFGADAEHAGM